VQYFNAVKFRKFLQIPGPGIRVYWRSASRNVGDCDPHIPPGIMPPDPTYAKRLCSFENLTTDANQTH